MNTYMSLVGNIRFNSLYTIHLSTKSVCETKGLKFTKNVHQKITISTVQDKERDTIFEEFRHRGEVGERVCVRNPLSFIVPFNVYGTPVSFLTPNLLVP